MDELGAETEKPSEAHECNQADIYFKDNASVLSAGFCSGGLLPGGVDGPHGMGKSCNVVQKHASYGGGEGDNLGIVVNKPAGFFIAISDVDHLKVIKEDTDTHK